MGICHQVNLEHLSRVVFERDARPSTTPSSAPTAHTTMVNGLGVLGWGVGGIEAEAAMLGQPTSMLIPPVVGLKLTGATREGVTATDVVLTITQLLRRHGVVGKFVEAYGPGVASLSLETRATIGNMSPEYGATCTLFPVDRVTLDYLAFTGRPADQLALVEAYARAQGTWHDADSPEPAYSEYCELDLATVEPSLAGPKRPQDRVALPETRPGLPRRAGAPADVRARGRRAPSTWPTARSSSRRSPRAPTPRTPRCSSPPGLVARRAVERGLSVPPWVKTSLAPGSRVVIDYLERAGLVEPLEKLGFYLAGFGCTTCIGNSGPLLEGVSEASSPSTTSRSRRSSRATGTSRGASTPTCARTTSPRPRWWSPSPSPARSTVDLTTEPLGTGGDGEPVFLADLWPTDAEVAEAVRSSITPAMFDERYAAAYFDGDERWAAIPASSDVTYDWDVALDLRQAAAVLRRPHPGAGARRGLLRRARAGQARRLGHDRPHLPGRLHPPDVAGRPLPHRRRGVARATSTATARAGATTRS